MIRFIGQNLAQGTEEVLNKLRNEDHLGDRIELVEEGEIVTESPFAYVDNKLVKGDTPTELYDKIKEELTQN